MKAAQLAVLCLSLPLLGACAALRLPSPAPEPAAAEQPLMSQTGLASWYGRPHHGRRTASGERFDMHADTAAHRSIELGTVARVTNLETGRTTKVRINDRGPYVAGRVIDLSAGVARRLGMAEQGLARVRIEVFASDQEAVSAATP
jgi:rare lipoprotein A